jgi:hypothetical protein
LIQILNIAPEREPTSAIFQIQDVPIIAAAIQILVIPANLNSALRGSTMKRELFGYFLSQLLDKSLGYLYAFVLVVNYRSSSFKDLASSFRKKSHPRILEYIQSRKVDSFHLATVNELKSHPFPLRTSSFNA